MTDEIRLTLHTHTRTEILFDQLATLLEAAPPAPFEQLPFLIQGRGMERWLQQRLSERFGVFSQGTFLFPIHFFAQVAQAVGVELDEAQLDRAHLRWRIEDVLRRSETLELTPQAQALLAPHLNGDRQRFLLAMQLANLFDQYQIMRPDWLDSWARNEPACGLPHEDWQRAIWRALALPAHRGSRWRTLIERLNSGDIPDRALPERIFVFGISFMPTLMLEVLDALSRHVPVHLFVLTPTADFFGDLNRRRGFDPDDPFAGETHHPLLVALAQQGRHFQNLLETLENQPGVVPLRDAADETTPPPSDLIGRLQHDLRHNRTEPAREAPARINVEFHRCHTPLRELEVVRDRIDALLAKDERLTASDIVVMSPDIAAYRPYIETVFADLPHSVADRSLALDNPAAQSLSQWLDLLAEGTFGWEALFAFISREDVAGGLGLGASELEQLRQLLVERGQVRLGLDDPHHANTWLDGVRRLLLGAVMDDPDGLWRDWAPVGGVSGQTLPLFAPVLALLDELQRQHRLGAAGPQPVNAWLDALRRWNDLLYADQPAHHRLIDTLLSELEAETTALQQPQVSLETLAIWADTLAQEKRASHGFLSRGITFCDLLPMRAIPMKVVVLVGMNDLAWPRPWQPPEYDLIAARFRPGDRNPRAEDRYTFLELLLGVRQRLVITWQGLSPDKNEPLPPAQVIIELRELLANHYGIDVDAHTFSHADRPFHSAYFVDNAPRRLPPGRQARHYRLARALHEEQPRLPSPLDEPLPPVPLPDPLPLPQLSRLLAHPVRWLLGQHQLGLNVLRAPPPPRPMLTATALDRWQVRESIGCAAGVDATRLRRLQGEGRWPLEPVGTAAWTLLDQELNTTREQLKRLQDRLGERLPARETRIELEEGTLLFDDDARHEAGRLLCRPHRLKGRLWLEIWLGHLAACATDPCDTRLLHTHEGRGRLLQLTPLMPDTARAELEHWLALARQATEAPLPLLADWLWQAVEKGLRDGTPVKAEWRKAARLSLGLAEGFGDHDPRDAVLTTVFDTDAATVLEEHIMPLWETLEPRLMTATRHSRLETEGL